MAEVNKPVPNISPSMASFYDGAKQGRLLVQKCDDRGLLRFPAHELCSNCLSTRASWVGVSGRGEVYSFNVMHQIYLEEGPKVVSNLVGVKPHEIKCGMPVEVMFEKLNDQVTLPKFGPRASQ